MRITLFLLQKEQRLFSMTVIYQVPKNLSDFLWLAKRLWQSEWLSYIRV